MFKFFRNKAKEEEKSRYTVTTGKSTKTSVSYHKPTESHGTEKLSITYSKEKDTWRIYVFNGICSSSSIELSREAYYNFNMHLAQMDIESAK